MDIKVKSSCYNVNTATLFCLVDGLECEVAIALPGNNTPHLIQGLILKCFKASLVSALMTAIAAYCGKRLPQYKELVWNIHDKSILKELGIEA